MGHCFSLVALIVDYRCCEDGEWRRLKEHPHWDFDVLDRFPSPHFRGLLYQG